MITLFCPPHFRFGFSDKFKESRVLLAQLTKCLRCTKSENTLKDVTGKVKSIGAFKPGFLNNEWIISSVDVRSLMSLVSSDKSAKLRVNRWKIYMNQQGNPGTAWSLALSVYGSIG